MKKNIFQINESEKNRILNLHKSATENFYLILEQSISSYQAGTDADTITHAKLAEKRGLPYTGKENENTIYQTGIRNLLAKASTLGENQKLSIFNPIGGSFPQYTDYLSVVHLDKKGNPLPATTLQGPGTQTFTLSGDGRILASHNGLLAISRIMDQMTDNSPTKMVITFGTQKGQSKAADDERYGRGVAWDAKSVMNQQLYMKSIVEIIVIMCVNPSFRPFITESQYNNLNDTQLIAVLRDRISKISRGDNGFLAKNTQRREEIIKTTNISGLTYDVTPIVTAAKTYSQTFDGNYYGTENLRKQNKLGISEYNSSKGATLSQFGSQIMGQLVPLMQTTYMSNLQKFIDTYLSDNRPQIQGVVDMSYPNFEGVYKDLFNRQPGTEGNVGINMTQKKQNYKKGE